MMLNAILQLRRDNDYNYEKIKDSFKPYKGEVVLVDTSRDGLRAKIGDGIKTYAELPFIEENTASNIIIRGVYHNNNFYYDTNYDAIISPSLNKIYIDNISNKFYFYDGQKYIIVNEMISAASASTAGIMKLYDTIGTNTDGTMTQKAITEELSNKVELSVSQTDDELLVFSIG